MNGQEKKKIWFLISGGSPALDVAGPFDVFRHANRFAENEPYELISVAASERTVNSKRGLNFVADCTLSEAVENGMPHTIIVCGSSVPVVPGSDETVFANWIRENSQQCQRICSVCTGAFILGEAGMLDCRSATTHWLLLGHLKQLLSDPLADPRRDPQIADDALFVTDHHIWTSAGVLSGIDMALTIVEEDLGFPIAQQVAQFLVMFVRRSGKQSQHSQVLADQATERSDMQELQAYIAAHLGDDLSLEKLAEISCMSSRNLARVFKREFGESIGKSIRQRRMDEACRLIKDTDLGISRIAKRVGVGDESTLRRWFVAQFGISPRQFRKLNGQRVPVSPKKPAKESQGDKLE